MESPLANVVEGYATLGSLLVDRWREQAATVAKKLDDGTYDANGAVADMAKAAALVAESGFLLASEALDAAAILTGRQAGPHIVLSEQFTSPVPGAQLSVAAPLTNLHGSDSLSAIKILPKPKLDPGITQFQLQADATGHRAGTYMGEVVASGAGPPLKAQVWIIVP
jgi:hypothetical protein